MRAGAGRGRRYEKYAWGLDELLPLEQAGKNSFAGMAATLLDGLSTLWLMGLKAEFGRGREWVAAHLNFTSITQVCCHDLTLTVSRCPLRKGDWSADLM